MSESKQLAIIGQGAIATLFSFYWRSYCPTILVKSLPAKNISLTLLDTQTVPINAKLDSVNAPQSNHFEFLLVAVKSYQTPALIKQLKAWLQPNTRLILVQNGMGGAELLAKAFPNNPLWVGTTTDAVFKSANSGHQVSAYGRLDIGAWHKSSHKGHEFKDGAFKEVSTTLHNETPLTDEAMTAFIHTHPNAHTHQTITIALHQKLAINAVINPLTALLAIKNGQLAQHLSLVECVKKEINLVYSRMFEPSLIQINGPLSAQYLSQLIDSVIESTADNYSSMHQDVYFKRQTEVDAMLGYLIDAAHKYGLAIPNIERLHAQVLNAFQLRN